MFKIDIVRIVLKREIACGNDPPRNELTLLS